MEPASPAAHSAIPPPARAEFHGSGGEYFRIWIVNLALTLATLGIYSAWAKVRREQYLHRNTRLAGAGFDYDARPLSILRGRLFAIALLVVLNLAGRLSPYVSVLASVAFVAIFPWMVTAALRFRLYHTLHRGLRFAFLGRVGEAARAFLLWPVAGVATLGLLIPVALQRQQRFVYGRSAFGGSPFESQIPVGAVYQIYFGTIAILVGVALCALVLPVALSGLPAVQAGARSAFHLALLAASVLAAFVVSGAYFQVRLHNLVWNALRLGPHRFRSRQALASFLPLQVVNVVGTVATLGLFRPWAVVRSARYRAEHLELVPGASLDEFAAGAAQARSAAADEIAEIFGFDLGF
jgi:uncharacterized membrane protein YjgN (DUF898 family)